MNTKLFADKVEAADGHMNKIAEAPTAEESAKIAEIKA